ncbi:EST1 family protein [Schizosaccharomyces japonicus yFS275]|uniref:Nonsense-mediated mRNA decay factor n=1 Tax=Schizosaccharomyces japonicus (strain yFS275 / FY16936) TaxID=402676 RepID=B6JYQ5_SCHJY|nr:EST1 family protein [Schizosaccharomyces japonicus yFS275]EEB06673.1 EST1 family protein [Schizosaccharomyces japonicus yFS275]
MSNRGISCNEPVSNKLYEQLYRDGVTKLQRLKELIQGHNREKNACNGVEKGASGSDGKREGTQLSKDVTVSSEGHDLDELFALSKKITKDFGQIIREDLEFSNRKELLTLLWGKVHYRLVVFTKKLVWQKSDGNNISRTATRVRGSGSRRSSPGANTAVANRGIVKQFTRSIALHVRYLDECVQFYQQLIREMVLAFEVQELQPLLEWLQLKRDGDNNGENGTTAAGKTVSLKRGSTFAHNKKATKTGTYSSVAKCAASISARKQFYSSTVQKNQLVWTVYRSLISLGDLCRYLAQAKSPKQPDYGAAVEFYRLAGYVMPDVGIHFHQLGLIAASAPKSNVLQSVAYFYAATTSLVRSGVSSAYDNLGLALRKFLRECDSQVTNSSAPKQEVHRGKTKEPSVVQQFLKLHANYECNSENDALPPKPNRLLGQLRSMLNNHQLPEKQLLAMSFCNIAVLRLSTEPSATAGLNLSETSTKAPELVSFMEQFILSFFMTLLDVANEKLPLQSLTAAAQSSSEQTSENPVFSRLLSSIALLLSFMARHPKWAPKQLISQAKRLHNRLSFFWENSGRSPPTANAVKLFTASEPLLLPFICQPLPLGAYPSASTAEIEFLSSVLISYYRPSEHHGNSISKCSYDTCLDAVYLLLQGVVMESANPNASGPVLNLPTCAPLKTVPSQPWNSLQTSSTSLINGSSSPINGIGTEFAWNFSALQTGDASSVTTSPSRLNPFQTDSVLPSLQLGRMVDSLVGPAPEVRAQPTGGSMHSLQFRVSTPAISCSPTFGSVSSLPSRVTSPPSPRSDSNGVEENEDGGLSDGEHVLFRPIMADSASSSDEDDDDLTPSEDAGTPISHPLTDYSSTSLVETLKSSNQHTLLSSMLRNALRIHASNS